MAVMHILNMYIDAIRRSSSRRSGFTIVEIVVYIGLFALMVSGFIATGYTMFESAGRAEARALLTTESNFLLAKFNWAMNGATSVDVSASPPRLVVTRASAPTLVTIDLASDSSCTMCMRLQRDASTPVVLNSSWVSVSNLSFTQSSVVPAIVYVQIDYHLSTTTPQGVIITESFSANKYLRK